ncbi:MAG: hypothetical protein ACYS0E_10945 [Planctomycetota bacterium]|jgi:hypothetical protein
MAVVRFSAACLLLAACTSTIRGYEGEELPSEELAVIVCHKAKAQSVRILSIDGVKTNVSWKAGDCLQLAPGTRRLFVRVHWTAGLYGGGIDPVSLGFGAVDAASAREGVIEVLVSVEAGRRYIFGARNPSDGRVVFEVVDSQTDELIAGQRLHGIFAFQE